MGRDLDSLLGHDHAIRRFHAALRELDDSLYRQYDERFVYAAPDLRKVTARKEWDGASPAFDAGMPAALDYEPRASS